eukprot:364916-Chlamydomonas_euryale.AAC.4
MLHAPGSQRALVEGMQRVEDAWLKRQLAQACLCLRRQLFATLKGASRPWECYKLHTPWLPPDLETPDIKPGLIHNFRLEGRPAPDKAIVRHGRTHVRVGCSPPHTPS